MSKRNIAGVLMDELTSTILLAFSLPFLFRFPPKQPTPVIVPESKPKVLQQKFCQRGISKKKGRQEFSFFRLKFHFRSSFAFSGK